MKKILAITPYPNLSADTRYRITQFIPHLEQAGWAVDLRPMMDDRLFAIYNHEGKTVEKITRTFQRSGLRVIDCLKAHNYDLILLHKEAYPFGPPVLENLIHRLQPRIIYDMDDAFWSHPPQLRQIGRFLRDPQRIDKIISLSSHVLAGNPYLADYALQFNSHVSIFPTVLNTERYTLRHEVDDGRVTIGWVGRWSSSPYLDQLIPVFKKLLDEYPAVNFRFVGADPAGLPANERMEFVPWQLQNEIIDIRSFDIGIMPLPNDVYSLGKCGFKLLQYMALGIPAVASPIGVNKDIIQDGINGFLATTETEWFDSLSILIKDIRLRKEIGLKARQTVKERYAVEVQVPILLNILKTI